MVLAPQPRAPLPLPRASGGLSLSLSLSLFLPLFLMHLAQGRCTAAFSMLKICFFRFGNLGAPIRSCDRAGGTPGGQGRQGPHVFS